jgi:electron transfer flavoprotein beta subunit
MMRFNSHAMLAWNAVPVGWLAAQGLSNGHIPKGVLGSVSGLDRVWFIGADVKIIVCIKVVPDISVLNFDLESRSFDPDDFVYIVNPLDLVALETALDIKESVGSGEVICLSIGPPLVVRHLRQCLAMGSDKAILLWDNLFTDSDGLAKAVILSSAIEKMGFDLILSGGCAQDDEDGMVGISIAGILNVPHISYVTQLEILKDGGMAKVHRALEKGDREVLECSLPALYTVHQTMNSPRYPTFPASLASIKEEIPIWGLAELGLREDQVGTQGSRTSILNFSLPRPRPKVTIRLDSNLSPAERMKFLVSGGLGDKKGDLLEGDARELAEKIVQIIEGENKKRKDRG